MTRCLFDLGAACLRWDDDDEEDDETKYPPDDEDDASRRGSAKASAAFRDDVFVVFVDVFARGRL